MKTLTAKVEAIIDAMIEAANASTIHHEMLDEIKQLRTNGFDTHELFGVRGHEFVFNNFEMLPLCTRVNWFNSIA